MKHILRLMTVAALATLFAVSCKKDGADNTSNNTTAQKPVVTADMYSVTANAETGEVVFKFTASDLSPFWTVVEPSGNKTTFTEREVTKTYKAKGEYKGNLIAYGTGGQSDPAEFTFTIGKATPADPELSATENILISCTWKIRSYGYYGGEGEGYWEWFEDAPAFAADDRFVFEKGGAFKMNLGEDKRVYNDDEGLVDNIVVSGNEKWAYAKEGNAEYVQFSDGGFPGMLGNSAAINGKYLISNLESDSFSLCYMQSEEQWFVVNLVDEDYVAPIEGEVTEEAAKAALSGKKLMIADYGWWGEGWQYFAVADGEEEIPANMANDFITFNANGTLTIELGLDDPLEEGGESAARVYNDGVENGEVYVVTGTPKWEIVTENDVVMVKFSNGGFPLVIAGKNDDPSDPDHHLGIDAKWKVRSVEDGVVGLEIYQSWIEQWLAVFLAPVAE